MPGWLGLTLTVAFALVAAYRGARGDAPGTLMALGMAGMAGPAEAAGLGAAAPHGPWWAAVFTVVAVWPLVGPGRAGQVCGGPVSHLVGGLAMIYMCMPATPPHGAGPAPAPATSALWAGSVHAAHHGPPVDLGGIPSAPAPLDGALALVGWALACYFLLATVTTLTRRDAYGALAVPRLGALAEAAMAFGTVIMLVAMT